MYTAQPAQEPALAGCHDESVVRLLALAAIIALVLVVLEPGGLPAREPGSSERRLQLGDRLLPRLMAGESFGALAGGWGDVWANDPSVGHVLRLDGRGGTVRARIPVGGRVALAVDRHSVWAVRWGGRFWRRPNGPLLRIDPVTDRVASRVALRTPGGEPLVAFGVLAGPGGVWVWGPRHVARIDPAAGRIAELAEVGDEHGELTGAVLAGGAPLAATADGHLVRFPRDGASRVDPRPAPLAGAELKAVAGPRLLAARDGSLLAVDPSTDRLLWQRPLGFHIGAVLAGGGLVLAHGGALGDSGDRLWALDAESGRVLASASLPVFGTSGMTAVEENLWIATSEGELVIVPRVLTRAFLARARGWRAGTSGGPYVSAPAQEGVLDPRPLITRRADG